MKRILEWSKVLVFGTLLIAGITSTLATPVLAAEDKIQPRDAEVMPINAVEEIEPTFVGDTSANGEAVRLKVGRNFVTLGNNIITTEENTNGIALVAGNNVTLNNDSEYGFIFGNIITVNGSVERDLFIAGKQITLSENAAIGRDVYTASETLTVDTDLLGDLSATAATVILKDVTIGGNVNLTADVIRFEGDVEILGTLVYNDNALITGLDEAEYGKLEAYHVEEISQSARLLSMIYTKFMSMASLFLMMAIIIALAPKLHEKIGQESDPNRFGMNLAIGIAVLAGLPIIAIVAFMTVVAAPIGLIALLVYGILIYLSQGFAGLWLGHLILEKLCKVKGNVFVEVLIGVVILGILSLIPYIGQATGFVGLVLGLGLIITSIKSKKVAAKAEK